MQSIEHASNSELLAALGGPRAAQSLMERFGGRVPSASVRDGVVADGED